MRGRAALVLAAAIALAACGGGGDERGATAATGASTAAPRVVAQELAFTAPLVGGGTFDGATLAGTPAFIWFWAPT